MEGINHNPYDRAKLGEANIQLFQEIVDVMAEIFDIPAGLIMRVDGPKIEVFSTSNTEGNPYEVGDNENYLGSGLYCEHVVKTEQRLLVPNALIHPDWDNNPDIKLNMVSYLGLPIMLPNGKVFGTICILDTSENAYSERFIRLLDKFKMLIESTLAGIHSDDEIHQRDEYVTQISKLFPICSYCKDVRTPDENWIQVEQFIHSETGQHASHGICPTCLENEMSDAKKTS